LVGKGCGYVVERGDIAALCDAIENVIRRWKTSYTPSCVEFAKTNFDKEKGTSEYIKLYNELQ